MNQKYYNYRRTRDGAVFFEIGANLVETNDLKEGE